LLENIQKLDGPTAAADAVAEEQEKAPISKKEKKRQKLAQKQGGNGEEEKGEANPEVAASKPLKVQDISDLIFSSNSEGPQFEISEIF